MCAWGGGVWGGGMGACAGAGGARMALKSMRKVLHGAHGNVKRSTIEGYIQQVLHQCLFRSLVYAKSCWKTKSRAYRAHGVIVLQLEKFEGTMLLSSQDSTYICGSSGQNLHTEKKLVYSKSLLPIQKEDIFDSAPKLFYVVKQNIRPIASKSILF